jgi:hypothetical protein
LKLYIDNEEITQDKMKIRKLITLYPYGNVEIDITMEISVEVMGKGKQYK